jgi:hypothetical protein
MKFKLLEPGDYETYHPYFRNQAYDLCIYTLPSLIVWTNNLARHFAAVKDDALWMYIDYPRLNIPAHLIMPISPCRVVGPEELAEVCAATKFSTIGNVPASYIERVGRDTVSPWFEMEEQPEYEDYVYRTEDLAFLKGNKFAKKRNLISQFEREYLAGNHVQVETMTSANADESLEFLEKWCEEKDCREKRDKVLACEREAAVKGISLIDAIGMRGILLRIDGEVNAFGMASTLTHDTGVLHFEKAFSRVKGLYQYFDRECARQLFPDAAFINKENDMSIPEIAHSKNSYFPSTRIKSFKLTRIGSDI